MGAAEPAPSPRQGLTSAEVAARFARDGPNRLPETKPIPVWRRLGAELFHFFALMLWIAGALAVVAGMPQLGAAIFVVIGVNGVFAFAQERRAERAATKLRELLPTLVVVRRDATLHTVDASELVVGDRVVLGAGDRVGADLELDDVEALSLDESTLTGESVPVAAEIGARAFAGTFVVGGLAEGVVVATGERTRLAGIARLTAGVHRPRSPVAAELDRIVRTIAGIAGVVGAAFFAVALLVGTPARDGFLFSIGVTVALVPEGLLPTVTLSLAIGAQRMAQRQALVRHLEAVETLGSTTFICTDKTGTLTQNEMSVVEAWTPVGGTIRILGVGYEPDAVVDGSPEAIERAAQLGLAALCVQGRAVERAGRHVAVGDPMDAAIDAFATRLRTPRSDPILKRYPFDPLRRRSSVVFGPWLIVMGAPDSVLERCDSRGLGHALAMMHAMAARGLRVLAVARRAASAIDAQASADDAERQLELTGIVGLHDPPRPEVREALVSCRAAGIRVAMLTGDHPDTARAIAKEVGLLGSEALVLQGSELPDDEAVLGALLDRDGIVISRVTPEDKLRIARALQARGHVVAMTGDGVNDGPALREADIGVAMGRSGTDVAREAADLVLLDDNFATIVAAVEQGRATFSNVRRFLTYHLTDNVAELTPFVLWALSSGRFPLALGVLQILFLDIGTDLLPALALGAEPPRGDLLQRSPLRGHLIDTRLLRRVFLVLGPAEALIEMTAFVVVMGIAGWRPGGAFPNDAVLAGASGAAFAAVVLGQAANAFACRSASRPAWAVGLWSNRLLVGAVVVELLALAGFLFVGPIADLLDHRAPPVAGLVTAALAIPAVLAADALHKRRRQRARDER